jgi:hypothetical protein
VRSCESTAGLSSPERSPETMFKALACDYLARSEGLEPPTS